MSESQFIRLRLFLEGIECPVLSATVTQAVGNPARASVQVPADSAVLHLAPRTMVHLFVYQPHAVVPKKATDDDRYVLLFSGDLTSVQYSKSSASRSATLICEDDASYYDAAHAYFVSQRTLAGAEGIAALTAERAKFIGATTGFVGATGAGDVLNKLLTDVFKDPRPASSGFADAGGLYGAILKLIETYMGIDDLRRLGANQFFSFHTQRKKLLSQIGAISADKTARKLIDANYLLQFIKQKADQLGQLVTLRQLVIYLLDFMYYRMIPCASAHYTPQGKAKVTRADPDVEAQIALLRTIKTRLEQGESAEDIEEIATFNQLFAPIGTEQSVSLKVGDREFSKIQQRIDALVKKQETKVEVQTAERLYTTLLLPHLYFAVPPSCNVLYPDLYSNFSYQRGLIEPTRLHLTTGIDAQLVSSDGVGDLVYYAPSLESIARVQSRAFSAALTDENLNQSVGIVRGQLFDHELYTGVIPTFSRIDRLAFMLAKNSVAAPAQEGGSLDAASEAGPDQRDDFFIRIANARFTEKKFAGRRAQASGVLNPFAVVGFPMVVIDGFATPRGDLYESGSASNEHYVGLLQSLTHTVSQESGGSTTYELGSVRPHRNKDDAFLQNLTSRSTAAGKTGVGFIIEARTSAQMANPKYRRILLTLSLSADPNATYTVTNSTGGGDVDFYYPQQPGRFGVGSRLDQKLVYALNLRRSSFPKDALGNTSAEQAAKINDTSAATYIKELARAAQGTPEEIEVAIKAHEHGCESLTDDETVHAITFASKVRMPPYPFIPSVVLYLGDQTAYNTAVGAAPLEEAIRPQYLDDIYASSEIGDAVYSPLLGVKSVIDQYGQSAQKQGAPTFKVRVGRGEAAKTDKEVVSLESVVDVMATLYAGAPSTQRAFRSIRRPIASLPNVLGKGGFHDYAWAGSNSEKPLPLLANVVYDKEKKRCPPGYRAATPNEVADAKKRVNPNLDVREDRHKRVLNYIRTTRNRGRFG